MVKASLRRSRVWSYGAEFPFANISIYNIQFQHPAQSQTRKGLHAPRTASRVLHTIRDLSGRIWNILEQPWRWHLGFHTRRPHHVVSRSSACTHSGPLQDPALCTA